MTEIYKSNGITIYGKNTPKGIEYLEYGNVGDPLIIYLHGLGEVGKTPSALLKQSPIATKWPDTFMFPEFFSKGIRVIAPVLKSGSWTPAYINAFLDQIDTTNLVCLMGWSWGGAGAGNYLNQVSPKYNFKCGVLMSMAGAGIGTNVKCPVKLIHATNDRDTSYKNSDSFWSGVPQEFKSSYDRPSSGGHYVWSGMLQPSTGIYEWVKSFSETVQPAPQDEIIPDPKIVWNKTKGLLIIEGVTYKLTEQ